MTNLTARLDVLGRTMENRLMIDRSVSWKRMLPGRSLLLLVVIVSMGFLPAHGQATQQTASKSLGEGASHLATTAKGPTTHGRTPSKSELYSMFFTYAIHVETKADAESRLGHDTSQFKDHLRRASGLNQAEYAYVLASAQRFVTASQEAKKQMADVQSLLVTQIGDQKRVPMSVARSMQAPLHQALAQRAESLKTEIAILEEELGQTREATLLNYLSTGYLVKNIGNVPSGAVGVPKNSTSRVPSSVLSLRSQHGLTAMPQSNAAGVILDSDYSCDDDDFSCADAQMAYLGPGNEVDLYANVDYGEDAVVLDEDGDIVLYTITSEGDLTSNGGAPVEYCSLEGGSCSASAGLSAGVTYDWDSTSTVYYFAECEDGSGDECEYKVPWTAEVNAYIPAPDVNSVQPTEISASSAGTMTIDGEGLISPFENQPTVTVANQSTIFSSFSVQSFNADAGTITVAYQVLANPTSGPQTVTVNNGFGSGEDELSITPSIPVINSITIQGSSDNNLHAGSTSTVVLSGTNFGTGTPIVSASAAGGSYVSVISGTISVITPGKNISFQVSTPISAPQLPVSFQLEANAGGSHPTGDSPAVSIDPYAARPPSIYDGLASSNNCEGTPISNPVSGDNTQNVYVGQLIQFTGCAPAAPTPLYVASMTWLPSDPDLTTKVTAGLSLIPGQGSYTSGSYLPVNLPDCALSSYSCDFTQQMYFIVPGTYSFTYTYVLSNGTSNSATVIYSVTGPVGTGNAPASSKLAASVCGGDQFICFNATGSGEVVGNINKGTDQNPVLVPVIGYNKLQNGQPVDVGIKFQIAATDPENSLATNPQAYQWVQLLSRTTRFLSPGGSVPCTIPLGLDNFYPYPQGRDTDPVGDYAVDAPNVSLSYAYCNVAAGPGGETNDSFQATMYLLWDPSLNPDGTANPGCAASNHWTGVQNNPTQSKISMCGDGSVPVPLASVTWGFCGDAINISGNGQLSGSWSLDCNVSSPVVPVYQNQQSFSGFPKWTGLAQNQ